MDIKYNVSKIKSSKEEVIKDSVSVEEPLEMRLKYKKDGKLETQNISITMRTPGNDEDLIRGFLFNERIIENMNEIDNVQHIGDPVGDYNSHNTIEVSQKHSNNSLLNLQCFPLLDRCAPSPKGSHTHREDIQMRV